MAGEALREPRSADFVAGAALREPSSADVVARAALCVPESLEVHILCVNLEVHLLWQAQHFVNLEVQMS